MDDKLTPELEAIVLRNLHDIYGYDVRQIAREAFAAGAATRTV